MGNISVVPLKIVPILSVSEEAIFFAIHGETQIHTPDRNNPKIIKNFLIASREYLLSE